MLFVCDVYSIRRETQLPSEHGCWSTGHMRPELIPRAHEHCSSVTPYAGCWLRPSFIKKNLRHLGWCGHRDRTASAASATAAAVSTAAVSTAVSTAIATAHRRPPGTAAGAARRVQGGQERPLSTFSGLGALKWLWVFAGVWLGPLGPLADAWKAFGRELCRRLSACRWLCENETVECLVCGPI